MTMVCSANQWASFYMIEASFMKELNNLMKIVKILFVTRSWKATDVAKSFTKLWIYLSWSWILLQKYFRLLTKLEANKALPSFTIFSQIIITCYLKVAYENKVFFLTQLFQFVIYTFYVNESFACWQLDGDDARW